MTMSGWAKYDKQPWTHGEPYTSINRKYLELKMRLLPYQYSHAYESHRTGLAMARAMLWEFPEDTSLYEANNITNYQFMSGSAFLVAPVYENT